MRLEELRYFGRGAGCPLCGGRFRSFAPSRWDGSRWTGQRVRCPRCGSLPRQRLLWAYLVDSGLLAGDPRVLHLAPEPALAQRLDQLPGYVSADLEPGRAMVQADLTALPFDDAGFEIVLCSHVLEHVPDDVAAMRELHRVLAPGGTAIVQTPVNYQQAATYEDPGETDAAERERRFSQPDHLRVYGPDLRDRLEATGFDVTVRGEPGSGPLRNDLYICVRRNSGG